MNLWGAILEPVDLCMSSTADISLQSMVNVLIIVKFRNVRRQKEQLNALLVL